MSGLSTLTEMPAQTYAGDTFLLELSYSAFPASAGWSLQFSFRNQQGDGSDLDKIDFTSAANGDKHLANVAASVTTTWKAGDYAAAIRAVNGAAKGTMWRGRIKILPGLKESDSNIEMRSWARRCLQNLQAVMEGSASRDVINSNIAGQSIGRMTPEQRKYWHDFFALKVQQEEEAERAAQGLPSKNLIGVAFVRP